MGSPFRSGESEKNEAYRDCNDGVTNDDQEEPGGDSPLAHPEEMCHDFQIRNVVESLLIENEGVDCQATDGGRGWESDLKTGMVTGSQSVAHISNPAWTNLVDDVQHIRGSCAKDLEGHDERVVSRDPKMDVESRVVTDIYAELAELDLGQPGHNVLMLLSQPIATSLRCSICEDIIHDAYKCLECMHSYCYSCLLSKIEIGNPKNICPVKNCGCHDIDGFTPTFLGPNPLTGSKPRVLPDSLLSGIVKKVFSFGADTYNQPAGALSTQGHAMSKMKIQSAWQATRPRRPQISNLATSGRPRQDAKPISTKDAISTKHTFELGRTKSIIASQAKTNVHYTADRQIRKARACAPSQACTLDDGLSETRRESSRRLVGRKRAGLVGSASQAKRLSCSPQATLVSLLSIGLFPVDALDDVQKLPHLENNYMRLPLSTPLEVLLGYVRSELKSAQMVLFCRDRLLMQDLDKPLEWVRKEIWLPRNHHHDVFSLYYSDSNILPDAHWLRDQ